MELVHDIFFYYLKFKHRKKCVTDISILFYIILEKCITWTLKHSFNGPNCSFS